MPRGSLSHGIGPDAPRRRVFFWYLVATLMFAASAVTLPVTVDAASGSTATTYSLHFGGRIVSAAALSGPGGPYLRASAVAQLLNTQIVVSTETHTITFGNTASTVPTLPSAAGAPGNLNLTQLPSGLVLSSLTTLWTKLSPSHSAEVLGGSRVTQGILVAGENPGGPCSASNQETILTNGEFKSLRFTLAEPIGSRNANGFSSVSVLAGPSPNALSLRWHSPFVSSAFLPLPVAVNITGAKVVRILTAEYGGSAGCGSNSSWSTPALILANSYFSPKAAPAASSVSPTTLQSLGPIAGSPVCPQSGPLVISAGPLTQPNMSLWANGAAGSGWIATVKGHSYAQGLTLGACAGWSWFLGGRYHTLSAMVGLDNASNSGNAIIRFVGDGRVLRQISLAAGGQLAVPVNIDVMGVQVLSINYIVPPNQGLDWVDIANDQLS